MAHTNAGRPENTVTRTVSAPQFVEYHTILVGVVDFDHADGLTDVWIKWLIQHGQWFDTVDGETLAEQ
jgi:hypothetical protein